MSNCTRSKPASARPDHRGRARACRGSMETPAARAWPTARTRLESNYLGDQA
jgi:hypothetical protein